MAAQRVTGSVITVQRRNGAVYYLKVRDRSGRQIKRRLGPAHVGRGRPAAGTWTQRQAEDALRDLLTDLGREPDGPAEGVTFADAVRSWLHYVEHDRKRRPSTIRDYRIASQHHLLPEFGSLPLAAITVDDVDRWRARLVAEGVLTDRTINKLLAITHGVFRRAQRVYALPTNPVAAAERQPSHHHGDIQVLDPGDVTLLAGHARDEQDAAFYTVAAFTGLRLGELLALRWGDVDFAKRIVHVRWSYVGRRVDRPKTIGCAASR